MMRTHLGDLKGGVRISHALPGSGSSHYID